ncbi:olfactory receptor 5V1-like [Spea bombifrons]|uniref:olfactory receptor 5V1-like n=1 Tax=Spea bombifrons TaxID=233779 RepID=UPI00234AA918|nr:olfactory receptor 5V1-like [Spea bombifrons]
MKEDMKNSTLQQEFHILAFTSLSEAKIIIFITVLLTYLLSVLGNLIIIVLVCLVSRLHTPMYGFLCILSVQDIINVSCIQPKLLHLTLTGNTGILFQDCIIQLFIFIMSIDTEFFLLTAMAFDRYVAVCIPLRYSLIMKKRVCMLLAASCWVIGALNAMVFSLIMSNLPFCKSREINNFFCEVETMLKLSCKDTRNIQILILVEGLLMGFVPFSLILSSYILIIFNILKIRTSEGRRKTFSSCSSHLSIVILLYGTCLSSYVKPESANSREQDNLISMLYIFLVPLLNPIVYSLRNKEILRAIKNITRRKK